MIGVASQAGPAAYAREIAALQTALLEVQRTVYALQRRLAPLCTPPAPGTLRARREALGLSQPALAHATGVYSRGTICDAESGRRKAPLMLAIIVRTLDALEAVR